MLNHATNHTPNVDGNFKTTVSPALNSRKKELEGVTLKGHDLNTSELKKTPEGLQEYWIQCKNKEIQSDCN